MRLHKNDWIQDLYYEQILKPQLQSEDYYIEDGKVVMTETYHKKRGYCCNSGCRHCAYKNKKKLVN